MRRLLLLSALLALALLPQAGAPSVSAGTTPTHLLGDADCSGSVNPVDGLVVLRQDAGSGDAQCAHLADVQCDGDVDPIDALQLLRFDAGLTVSQQPGCTPIGQPLEPEEPPPTSEALIAAALEAGDITYEESLLYRAYAIYADARLPAVFASPVMDLKASMHLFGEVDEAQGQLSQTLLDDLAPFRARPNDPISVLYDLPIEGAAPQGSVGWQSAAVPGTGARVWAFGPPGAPEPYVATISTVWSAFLGTFAYPNPDQPGDPTVAINPDSAIDLYVVDISGIDPRSTNCTQNPTWCTVGSRDGFAQRAAPYMSNKSSGYLVINARTGGDNLFDTIAHELTHVSQFAYDRNESIWLMESTATWVAYRVMKDLGKTPQWAYDRAEELFGELDKTLNRDDPGGNDDRYGSWLFFQHAAMVADDAIVSAVWQDASALGTDDIGSVDVVFNLDNNFDEFTVRNWNIKPPIQERYKDAPDATFPDSLMPEPDRDLAVSGEADYTLDLPVEPLSARYYRFAFNPAVRHIIVENNLVETDHAHVWLLKKIDGDWKPPEDMAGAPVTTFCRDAELFEENLEELIVIVSNSALTGPPIDYNDPRVIADQIACEDVTGWASTSLRIQDDLQDITYQSGMVNLRFKPRDIQDVPGNVQYDLASQSQGVHWVASGTYGGCPAEGEATVLFPGVPYTGIENAAGYLVVVAPGDNHSVLISAFDPSAFLTVTCPTEPEPTISKVPFEAGYLLHILGWPNSDNGTAYKGDCSFRPFENTVYHFTWDLRAPDVLAPLGSTAQPAGPIPECFDIPSPP